jgi:two-component system, sensor histidine kinase PdtaS
MATLLVAAGVAARYWLFGPGPGTPFLLFFPVVVLCGMAFDRGTGICATVLSCTVAVILFVEPVGSLRVVGGMDVAALLIFGSISLLSAVLDMLHLLLARATVQQSHLAAATTQLSATLQKQARSSSAPETRRALFEETDRIEALAAINDRLDRASSPAHVGLSSRHHDATAYPPPALPRVSRAARHGRD